MRRRTLRARADRGLGAGGRGSRRIELRQGASSRGTRLDGPARDHRRTTGSAYAVDGDGDGKVKHSSPADSRRDARPDDLGGGRPAQPASSSTTTPSGTSKRSSPTRRRWRAVCQVKTVAYAVALPGPTNAADQLGRTSSSPTSSRWSTSSPGRSTRGSSTSIGAISQQHHDPDLGAALGPLEGFTAGGNVSNHYYGRAHGHRGDRRRPCTNVLPDGPCVRIARQSARPASGQEPTELIYCFGSRRSGQPERLCAGRPLRPHPRG